MRKFSLVVITKNEARNIGRCLTSVCGLTDDIVIFDSGSTDETLEICRQFGARVFQNDFVDFSDQKNRAAVVAKYDWILSLDADEAFDAVLKQKFEDELLASDNSFMIFNRKTYYCGYWVKHCGWYPDWKLRFYHRQQMKWVGPIHEELIAEAIINAVKMDGDLLHYSYYSVDEHKKQAEKFTQMKALKMRDNGDSDNVIKSSLSGLWKFIKIFIIKAGFLDGRAGWQISLVSAKAAFRRYKH